jgi:RND family efflux transporter MFP subunit
MARKFTSLATLTALIVSANLVVANDEIKGFVEPLNEVQVAAPEAGLIQSIDVKDGQAIQRGQTLARLDAGVLEATLALAKAKAQSKAQIDAAAAEYQLRKARLDAITKLHKQGNANSEELQRARRDAAIAESKLTAAREEVELNALEARRIEAQIERRSIRSPIDGVVLTVEKQPGEFLSPADPVFMTIANLETLRVRFHVATRRATQYQVGQVVNVLFPESGRHTQATIAFVSPVTDADSGTVRVDVTIDNRKGLFRSGVPCTFLPLVTARDFQKTDATN